MPEKIININESYIKKFIKDNRPPVELRDKLDLGYSYENNTIELFQIRPSWNSDKDEKKHIPLPVHFCPFDCVVFIQKQRKPCRYDE